MQWRRKLNVGAEMRDILSESVRCYGEQNQNRIRLYAKLEADPWVCFIVEGLLITGSRST